MMKLLSDFLRPTWFNLAMTLIGLIVPFYNHLVGIGNSFLLVFLIPVAYLPLFPSFVIKEGFTIYFWVLLLIYNVVYCSDLNTLGCKPRDEDRSQSEALGQSEGLKQLDTMGVNPW